MGIGFSVYPGTGKAHCQICRKLVQKDQIQVTAEAYHGDRGSVHLSCLKTKADQFVISYGEWIPARAFPREDDFR